MAVIDLSQLPAPQIVDVPDFETLLAERKAEFVALHPKDEQEAVIRTLELESEPVTKLLQENAYRELLLRQRINEAAQAVMVAYAMGGDLDQIAANYNVKRLTVTPADNDAVPPVAAVMEPEPATRCPGWQAHHWQCCDTGLLHRVMQRVYLLRRCRLCAVRHH